MGNTTQKKFIASVWVYDRRFWDCCRHVTHEANEVKEIISWTRKVRKSLDKYVKFVDRETGAEGIVALRVEQMYRDGWQHHISGAWKHHFKCIRKISSIVVLAIHPKNAFLMVLASF